jgi:hypothetical protein
METLRSFAAMQRTPRARRRARSSPEITGSVVHEGEADPAPFRLLGALLEALEGGLDPWIAVRYAEYWTLRLHGVLPISTRALRAGPSCPPSDPRWVAEASVLCRRCPKPARCGRPDRSGPGGAGLFSKSEPSAPLLA